MSIDDQRRVFEPVLWREVSGDNDHQRIKQVWFSGMHANVGGGYPKQGIAWNALEWMMLHARKSGLRFVTEDILQFTENKDVQDKMYDSRSGLGAYYVYKPRGISRLWEKYASETSKPQVHISVFERIAIRTEGYAPLNLPEKFEISITEPVCADDKDLQKRGGACCAQYDKADIQRLKQQVSDELKKRAARKLTPGFREQCPDFIRRWSSYLFFFGLLAFWAAGYFNFDRNVTTFAIALLISIAYWFILWQISREDKIAKHKEISAFWRKTSSHDAWGFLKR